jgi:hypothetical protein
MIPTSHLTRRQLLHRLTMGMGGYALADLLGPTSVRAATGGLPTLPHHAPKAKRVIMLFMSGGMSQFETFDYKPDLVKNGGKELPDKFKNGRQKLLGMSGNQSHFTLAAPTCTFSQHGQSGTWLSSHLPHLGKVADDICVIKSLKSEAVNHDPAMSFMQSGAQLPGRPSMGAWISYGLGSDNSNLPSFIVMVSRRFLDQPLSSRLWDSGFLPTQYQGVQFRAAKDPVLYLGNPHGITPENERRALDHYAALQRLKTNHNTEAEITARIEQYEMAFRMQASIPEVTDVSREPESIFELYGPDSKKPGSFAANCIQARRLAEKGVRFIQLYHPGWDMHGGLCENIPTSTREIDQPAAALIQDLKNRDMLKDTLVMFVTEFGRTCYSQGKIVSDPIDFGREHHRDCFSVWMAGGGIKPGISHGETDELGFSVATDPMTVNDLHATALHLLGVDHEKFTYRFQGRDYRLTDVAGNVVQKILA